MSASTLISGSARGSKKATLKAAQKSGTSDHPDVFEIADKQAMAQGRQETEKENHDCGSDQLLVLRTRQVPDGLDEVDLPPQQVPEQQGLDQNVDVVRAHLPKQTDLLVVRPVLFPRADHGTENLRDVEPNLPLGRRFGKFDPARCGAARFAGN